MKDAIQIPEVGDTVGGRYELISELGRGGFGVVYVARHLELGRDVALKTLLPELTTREIYRARLEREARLIKELKHPNTVRLYDLGRTEGGILYLVMELVEGVTLTDAIGSGGPFSEARTVRVVEQILKSLMEAHNKGIIHRDLKHENVMLVDFEG